MLLLEWKVPVTMETQISISILFQLCTSRKLSREVYRFEKSHRQKTIGIFFFSVRILSLPLDNLLNSILIFSSSLCDVL